jgi:hypothetical protein
VRNCVPKRKAQAAVTAWCSAATTSARSPRAATRRPRHHQIAYAWRQRAGECPARIASSAGGRRLTHERTRAQKLLGIAAGPGASTRRMRIGLAYDGRVLPGTGHRRARNPSSRVRITQRHREGHILADWVHAEVSSSRFIQRYRRTRNVPEGRSECPAAARISLRTSSTLES